MVVVSCASDISLETSTYVPGYRHHAIETGWTAPDDVSLFPPGDPVLARYIDSAELLPFEKHLPNACSPYASLPFGGFITGKEAITQRGIDLRLFFDREEQQVIGVVRFEEAKTSIGAGFGLSVHGGAIQTVLDEATAEAGKMLAFPFLATRRIHHEIRKPVPSETTLIVRTEVTAIKGLRCFVKGEILDGVGDVVLAAAEAELVNMVPFLDKE